MKRIIALIFLGSLLIPAGFDGSNLYAITRRGKRKAEYIGGGAAGGALIGGVAGGGKGALIGGGAGAAGGYLLEKKTRHHRRRPVRTAHNYRYRSTYRR